MIWLEQLIIENLQALFPGLEIIEAYPFRVTRDAEVEIQELESDDLLETIEEAVWQRRFRAVVRLQVSREIPEHILETLIANLELDPRDVYPVDGPLDLGPPSPDPQPGAAGSERRAAASAYSRRSCIPKPRKIFSRCCGAKTCCCIIRSILSSRSSNFSVARRSIRKSWRSRSRLYRVGRNSPIVESLLSAIENGKQVAVLVELKARFDEESNIEWARALEAAGVHVVYGLVGLKVHSKVALVVRREGDAIRRYVHLGTGNYNPTTARLYTDLSLFTADEQIGADVTDLFNYLTGYSAKNDFRKLLVAPINMRAAAGGIDSPRDRSRIARPRGRR